MMRRRRVVVTGIGAVTPLGVTMAETWRSLVQRDSKSGVVSLEQALMQQGRSTEQFNNEWRIAQALPCQVAAPVDQNFHKQYTRDEVSADSQSSPTKSYNPAHTSRFVQLALTAAAEAVASAGLTNWWKDDSSSAASNYDQRRQSTGVSIGTGMSGVREIADAVRLMESPSGHRKLSPHFVPKVLGNSAAARISLLYGLRGPNLSAATACAAGSHAIGEAARAIQFGSTHNQATGSSSSSIDIMLAGGSESCIDPWSLAGFTRLRALSTSFNDNPEKASRPFDVERDGFVMGEGACVMVLEELEHARQRLKAVSQSSSTSSNPPPFLIELVGYGATADAHHITSPDPNGRGAIQAMQAALHDASFAWSAAEAMYENSNHDATIGYVNAHATSTPMGDEIEMKAIHQALIGGVGGSGRGNNNDNRRQAPPILVSSTKGATGHLLGAAGALEAAVAVQSLLHQIVPATHNLEQLATGGDGDNDGMHGLSFIQNEAAVIGPNDNPLTVAMSNSFGFGGTNSSLVFRRIPFDD